MYKASHWFVALSIVLLTAALLAGKSHLLVPGSALYILLGYCYAMARKRRKPRPAYPGSREEEVTRVEQQRYLMAKEALLDGAKRKQKQLRKQK